MGEEIVVVKQQKQHYHQNVVIKRTRQLRSSTSSLCPNHRKSTPTRWKKGCTTTTRRRSNFKSYFPSHYSSSHNSSFLSIFAIIVSFVVIDIFCLSTSVNSGLVLNSFIRHYEPAYFSKEHLAHQRATTNLKAQLHKSPQRRKRETHSQFYEKDHATSKNNQNIKSFRNERYHKPIMFNFTAHNRLFQVTIRQDAQSVFTDDVVFENSLGPINFQTDNVYSGFLEDSPSSSVHGIVTEEGHFDGHISTPTEHFYIEPARRYFPEGAVDFHSVIYSSKDVLHPSSLSEKSFETKKRGVADNDVSFNDNPTCKSHELYLKMSEERRIKENQHFEVGSHKYTSHGTTILKDTRDKGVGPPCTSESSIGDTDEADLQDDTEDVPINLILNNKSFIKSDTQNGSHNITNHQDFHFAKKLANSKNEAVMSEKEDEGQNTYAPFGEEEEKQYFSKRRIRRSTGYENQRYEVLPGREDDDSPMTVVVSNKKSATNSTRPVIKAEKQTVTTYEIIDWEDVPESVRHHFRKKAADRLAASKNGGKGIRFGNNRRLKKEGIDKKKTTCMLYLQADHLFHEQMGYSEEASIEMMTRHVQRVNSIYRPIDFDGDGKPDNISFMIKRIKVHTNESLNDPKYRFPGNYGVEKFLEIFSEENYDAFCLAYMFTFRDFEGGTLGLAWTGDLKNAGGVCEKNGHYRGSLKSLNTGIITLLNYGKHVPPAVSHVTMAHEMGHNFGSPHDPENNKACVPDGEDGNYIMFARATSGDKMNNRNFSPCSLKSVKQVLKAKARGSKGCFTEPKMALCGNGVVEEGEECDCGWEEDCEEECCWPQRTGYPKGQKPCTLRPQKLCSPTQGPCCNNDCSFKTGETKCRDNNGCRGESFCDGGASTCPMSELKPNKTVCNKEFVCYKGECTGSICLAYGMESCQCEQGPMDKSTKACELCCKLPGEDQECRSSFELNVPPLDVPDMFSKPGTPCKNYKGYCDVFQKCREVDPSGPLATLRNLLLGEESIASLKSFLISYWYTLVFIAVGIILLMAVIIKICGKKTPLVYAKRRNRHKTFHHDVLEVPSGADVEEGGGPGLQIHPTMVETSVPLGKKVRISMSKNRDKKAKRNSRSKSKDRKSLSSDAHQPGHHRSDRAYTRRERGKTEENIAKATQLAANLSQLLVTLPPERLGSNPGYVTSEGIEPSSINVSNSPPTLETVARNEGSSQDSPSNHDIAVLISDQGKAASTVQKNKPVREHSQANTKSNLENNQRRHKSTNSEKKKDVNRAKEKLNGVARDTLSKSFEKLDMISHRRDRAKRARARRHGAQSDDDSEAHIMEQNITEKKSRQKDNGRQNRATSKDAKDKDGGKEVTIARVGRFKFSLELNKKFDEETQQKEKRRQRMKHRSKSQSRTPSKSSRKRRREKVGLESKENDIQTGNTNDDDENDEGNRGEQSSKKFKDIKRKKHKISKNKPKSLSTADSKVEDKNVNLVLEQGNNDLKLPNSFHKAPSVIVSKQRAHDRPLLLNDAKRRQRKSVPAMPLNLKKSERSSDDLLKPEAAGSDSSDHEYEVIDLLRANMTNTNGDKFSRSVSHPSQPDPSPGKPTIDLLRGTSVCEPLSTKTNQNKGAAIRIRKHSAPQNGKTLNVDSFQESSRDRSGKIRRAETTKEKVSTRLGVSRKDSLLLLPDNSLQPSTATNRLKPIRASNTNQNQSIFDNHAYDKSPEPSSSDFHKKKLTKNRSELLLQDESLDKESNDLEGCNETDNLGGKLSRLSSLTLSSLNSTFQINKRRAEYSTKKKYHSVDSESPTHQYDNIPFPNPFSKQEHQHTSEKENKDKSEGEESSTDSSSGSSTSLTSPSSTSDSKRLSPQTQVQSLSDETSSLNGDNTSKMTNEAIKISRSISDQSNSDKNRTRNPQKVGDDEVDGSIGSSSEYSSDSEEDDDDDGTNDSDSDTSSSGEEEASETKDPSQSLRHLTSKPSVKEFGGMSRAQILENAEKEAVTAEANSKLQHTKQMTQDRIDQPSDLSLAFIGCEDAELYDHNPNSHRNPSHGMTGAAVATGHSRQGVSNNIRRKTSSLSQRYGMVRRSTSRGSGGIPIDGNNESENIRGRTGNSSTKNKSLELNDIQLDEHEHSPNGKYVSTKPQSPKFLRPENKIILGDSTDNVSILTDGML